MKYQINFRDKIIAVIYIYPKPFKYITINIKIAV